eukprot:TRINITY_DN7318_c0_g1_i1.p1 TRINITY_DN7318_c0_g1~~TRINITY_DN7318_c0_g1_i1.p1  ORF type:complete len:317 (-),score=94.10 TRINITY_DN7318_c0_g1_i1:158-1108(-)
MKDFKLQTDSKGLDDVQFILIAVKSFDTEATVEDIKRNNKFEKGMGLFVSMQNGVQNGNIMKTLLPLENICSASVGFNVILLPGIIYQRTTSTPIILHAKGTRELPLVRAFSFSGMDSYSTPDIRSVLFSKLVINLNNSVNALAGIPVKAMLSQWKYRKVVAEVVKEGVRAITANQIQFTRYGKIYPPHIPFMLELPDWLFVPLSPFLVKIDPKARSSMLEDLDAGKRTEIDLLNGEIIQLGKKGNVATPVNEKIVSLVKKNENSPGSPCISADELYQIVFDGQNPPLRSPLTPIISFVLLLFFSLFYYFVVKRFL